MGTLPSRHHRYIPVRPSESLSVCPGDPRTCRCPRRHPGVTQTVFLEPTYPGFTGQRRYLDPRDFFDRGDMGDLPYGGFGGLGWSDPRYWGTRDYDMIDTMYYELLRRMRRDRRRKRNRNLDDDDSSSDDERAAERRGRDNARRDYLASDTAHRLRGLENTLLGTEAERRDAALRERLARLLGVRYSFGVLGGGGGEYGYPGRGGGGLLDQQQQDLARDWETRRAAAERLIEQQREQERRERQQRDLDREREDLQRHLVRMRREQWERGEQPGGGPPFGPPAAPLW